MFKRFYVCIMVMSCFSIHHHVQAAQQSTHAATVRYPNTYEGLLEAARHGNAAEIRRLVEEENIPVDIEGLYYDEDEDCYYDENETPLMVAAENGQVASITELLRLGANIEAQDDDGWTALVRAARAYQAQAALALLRAGAHPHEAFTKIAHNNKTIMDVVVQYHHELQKKLSVQLFQAAAEGNVLAIRAIAVGINVNAQDSQGWTPLMNAAAHGQCAAIDALLAAGAYLNVQDADGWTALMRAAQYGHVEALKCLMHSNAAIDIKNSYGMTALDIAAAENQPLAVAALLQAGAPMDEKFQKIIKTNPQIMKEVTKQYRQQ